MKLIIVNGPSCAGKSSVVKEILSRSQGLFHLSYDRLKWLISDYERERDYRAVRKMVQSLAAAVFSLRYEVIMEGGLYYETRQSIIEKAQDNGYTVVEVNIEADDAVLTERFQERVAAKENDPQARISNVSIDRFNELLLLYEQEKNKDAITFDSEKLSVKEITDKILEQSV